MRILVTGATGFIGRWLVSALTKTEHEVAILVRNPGSIEKISHLVSEEKVFVDPGSPEHLAETLRPFKPDLCIHLASFFVAEHRPQDVPRLIESIIDFPTRVLEALKLVGCTKFINTGTSWQHYESDSYRPVCLYAATKQAFEDILQFYCDACDMQVVNLKLFDTYGEEDTRPKLLATLKRISLSGEKLSLSPGDQKIDLLHAEDVVRAYILCIENLNHLDKWSSFSVGSGELISLKEFVMLFEQISGKKLNVTFGERAYRTREVMNPWSTGRKLPFWKPEIDLKTGIKRFLND